MSHIPYIRGIFRYLEETEHKGDYCWFFTIPSNDDYPHGVWWNYNAQTNTYQSIGTTASLSGFIIRYGDRGVSGYCELLEDIEGAGLIDHFDYAYLRDKVPCLVRDKIHNEKSDFMANPLEFVLSPSSRFYEENKTDVEAALDLIIDQRPVEGVWGIPWHWYNGDKYPKAFAISENWWKLLKAIDKLLQLKSFGRFAN